MPDPVMGAVGSVAGGLAQAGAARKAASGQERAAERDLEFQRETRDIVFDRLDPYYQGGTLAQGALLSELGLGPRPMVGGNALRIEEIPGQMAAGSNSGVTRQPQPGVVSQDLRDQYVEFLRNRYDSGDRNVAINSFLRLPQDQQIAEMQRAGFRPQNPVVGQMIGAPQQTQAQFRVGNQVFNTREEAEAFVRSEQGRTGGGEWGGIESLPMLTPREFEADPGYQFRLEQGQDAVNALAGAQGGLLSGRTLEGLTDYNQGVAAQEYGNWWQRATRERDTWWNRLAGQADTGYGAAAAGGQAAQNTAAGVSNALSGIGNAQSAGAIGVGNAISSGIENGIGTWGYMSNLNAPAGSTTGGMTPSTATTGSAWMAPTPNYNTFVGMPRGGR